ncbi:LXN protein, partial [Ramphastos sulfuratus]|nr:LXN protein [Ramphastos sulfuratus]
QAMELSPSHFSASRAAALAAAYLCYRRGNPSRGLALRGVRRARREDITDVGHKYHLELVLEDVPAKDMTLNCTAEVLYPLGSQKSAPDVQFTLEGELRDTAEADNAFYNQIKSLDQELVAEDIPDSQGNVPPALEPVHLLAWVASGYLIWQNSTENTKFQLAQVKRVKQVPGHGCSQLLPFSSSVFSLQEIIPWQMRVLWHPQHGVQVTEDRHQPQHRLQ